MPRHKKVQKNSPRAKTKNSRVPGFLDLMNPDALKEVEENSGLDEEKSYIWARRYMIAQLYVNKVKPAEISRRLELKKKTVENDISALRKRWNIEYDEASQTIRAEMANKLDYDEEVIRQAMFEALGDFTPELEERAQQEGREVKKPRLELALRHWDRILKLYELRMKLFQIEDVPQPQLSLRDNRTYVQYNFESFSPDAPKAAPKKLDPGRNPAEYLKQKKEQANGKNTTSGSEQSPKAAD